MKVGELMDWLSKAPKDAEVIISSARAPEYDIIEVRHTEKEPVARDTVHIFIR